MSELAFDKEGNPFRFSRRTKKLRPRRWKNAGQRGTCAAVLDPDGEQLLVDADAEYTEFRAAVGNVPGFYRLDQCDEDGALIEDAPPAYVSIESVRNSAPVAEIDSRDALIRDLAQINAEMTRTIVERFSNVMQAAADVLRAADGAGLPRREPLPSAPMSAKEEEQDDDDDDDDDEGDDSDESERYKRHPAEVVWSTVEPMIPMIGTWLSSVVSKRLSSKPTPAASAPAEPAPAPTAPAPTAHDPVVPGPAAPAATAPAPAGPDPDPVAPVPVAVPAPSAPTRPAPAAPAPGAPAPDHASAAGALTSSAIVPTPGAPAPATAAPTAEQAPSIAADLPPGTATGTGSAAPSAALVSAAPAETGQLDGPRNALPAVEPTPEQWAHLYAIRARLSPREAAIAQAVVLRMPAELRAHWLAELSMLSVEEATEAVRSMIPKPTTKQTRARKSPEDDGQEEG
jgi:hypothetical protein